MVDLGDFSRLQNHVDTVHPERGQDLTDTVIDNVKGERSGFLANSFPKFGELWNCIV